MVGNKEKILEFLFNKDNDSIFEIKLKRYTRSQLQVKYYWWVIVDIIWDFHWYDPVETNEMLKTTFWVDTFTNLDTKEFKELIENIITIWKNKYWVKIPLPNGDDQSLFKSLFNN